MKNIKIIVIYSLLFILINMISCYKKVDNNIYFSSLKLKSGDAKFLGNNMVITSINGNMQLIDLNKRIVKELSIRSNWIDCLADNDKYVIIYSNTDLETGICIMNKNGDIIENRIIFNNKKLCIDPSILKVDNKYYITYTSIDGNINNANKNSENGEYSVELFESTDLVNWSFLNEVVKHKNNIEDAEIDNVDGEMYFIYEKEQADKGLSSICIKKSKDYGKSWSDEEELLKANADQEPAKFLHKDEKWFLYYSSDVNDLGNSYSKSKIYYAIYDEQLRCLSKDNIIMSKNKKGSLLYDVRVEKDKLKLLYSRDYLNENSLVFETLDLNE